MFAIFKLKHQQTVKKIVPEHWIKEGLKTWNTSDEVYCFIGQNYSEKADFDFAYNDKLTTSGSYVYRGYVCFVGSFEQCEDFHSNRRISNMPKRYVSQGDSEQELRKNDAKQKKQAHRIQKQQKLDSISSNSQ